MIDSTIHSTVTDMVDETIGHGFISWGDGGDLPPPVTLGTKTGVEPSEIITSRETYPEITAVISIVGGVGQLSKNSDVTWGPAVSMVPGDYYQARAQASSEFNTSVEVEVDVPDVFTIITRGQDITPDPFALITQTDVQPNTPTESNPPTISGIDNGCPISISAPGEYEINQSGVWTDQPGTIDNNNVAVARITSGAYGETVSTILTIGTVSRAFIVETMDDPGTPGDGDGWTPPGGEDGWKPPGGEDGWNPPGS